MQLVGLDGGRDRSEDCGWSLLQVNEEFVAKIYQDIVPKGHYDNSPAFQRRTKSLNTSETNGSIIEE